MFEINFKPIITALANTSLSAWSEELPAQLARRLNAERWGDLPTWQQALNNLPALQPDNAEFRTAVSIGDPTNCNPQELAQLKEALMGLHPWRKGPFDLFGLHIDTEWRSDWKWDRVLPHLAPLKDKWVLDVGCGSGYHCWRMHGEGAERVIGIDPSAKFVYQFYAIKHYAERALRRNLPVDVLPLGIEDIPPALAAFDTVFSMGVLYHRRQPVEHIKELIGCLKPGGQLIIETLVIEGEGCQVLVPEGRYAKMRNVWAIPTTSQMLAWMKQCDLQNPRLIDSNPTSLEEQRRTKWMTFESLSDFLDPNDSNRTIEGHPAPVRGLFIAERAG